MNIDIQHMLDELAPAQAPAAVAVSGLHVSRGDRRVLHGLDFSVARGRITGLLGPSGCGKTTLMRAVVGVQIVEAGDVRVLGEPAGSSAVRARVGYVMQAPAVYLDLSARENLRYFARVLGAPAARVVETLEIVQLTEAADRPVRNLSGGQRARVSLGTALLGDPDVLVLDEPTVGLDPVLREDLWRTFHGLAERGVTLLVSSHVMDEAARCDDLLLMRDGRLLATLTPAELRERTGEEDMERAFLHLIDTEEMSA
ncbi:MAG: ABC transporter ATP-binding protein [Actinomycetota bacterium]|nr:ABC transporter ATP-binding protein [Actinomycetota bacterium]